MSRTGVDPSSSGPSAVRKKSIRATPAQPSALNIATAAVSSQVPVSVAEGSGDPQVSRPPYLSW